MNQELQDSGKRENFDTGAVRDTSDGKPRPGLLSPFAAERRARIMALGANKYSARNWEKGMPFSRTLESVERHLIAWKQGQRNEDHLAQASWGLDALLHFEEGISHGFLPPELDDMPKYLQHPYRTTVKPDPQTAKDMVDSTVAPDAKGPVYLPYWDETKIEKVPVIDLIRDEVHDLLCDMGCDPDTAIQIADGTTCSADLPRNEIPKWAYIAGPMRGIEDYNMPMFDSRRDFLHRAGFIVISPADIDRVAGPIDPNTSQSVYVFRDFWALYFLAVQKKDHAYINLLPNWEISVGASAEAALAKWLGIAVTGESNP